MMPTHTEVAVDTSDLEFLDRVERHARCAKCYPPGSLKFGDPFTAMCGCEAVWRSSGNASTESVGGPVPSGACQGCVEAVKGSCPVCGNHV